MAVRSLEAACPVLQPSPYINEPSPFGWPVSPFNFDYASQSSWSSKYATCGGLMQSPIDIDAAGATCPTHNIGANGVLAHAASYSGVQAGAAVTLSAYMRTAYAQGSFGTLTLADGVYTAVQVHVTTPSFHTVNGQQYEAELLIVHVPQGKSSGLNGSVVVSVLFNAGGASSLFSQMGFTDDALPFSTDLGGSFPAPARIDVAAALAGPLAGPSYLYNGSVPVPPCTENVKWFVTTTPDTVSQQQINKLASALTCYAGGVQKRQASKSVPTSVCRNVQVNQLEVGGPHDQETCLSWVKTGSSNLNRTAACWDTAQPHNYYSKCLGSPIDIKSSQAHINPTATPASSFVFYKPVAEVRVAPSTYSLDVSALNRSQVNTVDNFGFVLVGGRQFLARKLSIKAISSHSIDGTTYAAELNIEHTLYGDDLHDLYNQSQMMASGNIPSIRRLDNTPRVDTLAGSPVPGDNLHRVIVSIPLTIGKDNALLTALGAGVNAYSQTISSGNSYNVQTRVAIGESLSSALSGSYQWYSGGLTKPGCSEYGVRWLVFSTPLEVSIGQLNLLNLPVSGMDSTRVNQTVIIPSLYADRVWRNSLPPFAADDIKGADQMCDSSAAWSYANTSCWTTNYPMCSTGQRQSPININSSAVTHVAQDNFLARTGWHPLSLLRVANTGRMLSVNNEQMGYVEWMGETGFPKFYQLTQFNLHMPSEHLIDGQQFAAELSIIHKNQKTVYQFDAGDLLVTSFLFNVGPTRSPLLDQLLGSVPIMPGQWVQANTPIDLLRSLGPALDSSFYRYDGSTTAPDCSEIAKYFVFERALNMSYDQFARFKAMFPSPSNNRPVQPLNGRLVGKNTFMEGTLQKYDYYFRRDYGVNRNDLGTKGPGWIIAPIIGTILLAIVVMTAVFVHEDRRTRLEGAGGLVEVVGRNHNKV